MPHTADLPPVVQTIVASYLEATHAAVPNLVEGFYLVGSVALDDFRPGLSDIDFAAVTAARPDAAACDALARVHARLRTQHRRPFFDGLYVTWDDLAHNPTQIDPGPNVHKSVFRPNGRGERHPVTWRLLAQQGVCGHGLAVADLTLWDDPGVLAAWTDGNLDAYWRRFLDRRRRLWTPVGLTGLTAWTCAWCVLGISRLRYTLATGAITSKTGAGKYAQATFGEPWQQVIAEALRIREGTSRRSLYRSPMARRRDVLAFGDMCIADAHRFYAERWGV